MPWIRVESTTTKKMMSKAKSPIAIPAVTGIVASQIGTAPRIPAQLSIIRSPKRKGANAVARTVARGRATSITTSARAMPSRATSPSSLGTTSRPSRKKSEICETQLSPWWKAVIVRRAGSTPVPSTSPVR